MFEESNALRGTEIHRRDRFAPGPELRSLMGEGTMSILQPPDSPGGRTGWLATGHDEVRQVLGSDKFSAKLLYGGTVAGRIWPGFLNQYDPPEHTRLRRMVTSAFTVRRMQDFRPRIEQIVQASLDAIEAAGGPVDFVPRFAWSVATTVTCDFLGIPRDDQADLSRALHASRSERSGKRRVAAGNKYWTYMTEIAARARRDPGDDMFGAVVRDHGDAITDAELLGVAAFVMGAGGDQVARFLAAGAWLMVEHPDQFALLREKPDTVPDWLNEVERYLTSDEKTTPRIAQEDVRIGDQLVKAGDAVTCSLLAANRRKFPAPEDEFDITRERPVHVTFGHGIHHCLGRPLAEMVFRAAIPALAQRFPKLRLAEPDREIKLGPPPFDVEALLLEW
ncbi:cytochrome P450 [Amycolatopsis balhimycina DSM 5908]|uniref:Cytochrome P450 n=2 Tax=Amycolatopsis balhimycina TaxID=208443 RepID=A0A428X5Y8_AMYBA|nr:cytochrome P450 [Amycolatopsis balhimycina]RSM50667.1 cytochrome P450 [Amycolatopsis balhimycina DSM 5908]CAA76547.1 P450 monooxygenase [Amycolatopsis balhimycina DSM 5908]